MSVEIFLWSSRAEPQIGKVGAREYGGVWWVSRAFGTTAALRRGVKRAIMPKMTGEEAREQEIALYDAIGRAIANLHAALAEVDAAWVLISAERPDPSVGAFAKLDTAERIVAVAGEDLARARIALTVYARERTE